MESVCQSVRHDSMPLTTACPYIIHVHWFKDTLDLKQVAGDTQ